MEPGRGLTRLTLAVLSVVPLAAHSPAVVPPPLCTVAAALPAPVACLALRGFGEDEAIAAVLSDGGLALLASVEEDLWEETLEEQLAAAPWQQAGAPRLLPRRLTLDSPALEAAAATGAGAVQAAAWVTDNRLLLVAGIASSASALLVELAVDEAAGTATEVAALDSAVPPVLACAQRHGPHGGVLLQQHSGRLLLYRAGGALQELPPAAGFPCACLHMAATPAAVEEAAGHGALAAPAAFGLSARGQLYWGSRQLAADVTSFAVRAWRQGASCGVLRLCVTAAPARGPCACPGTLRLPGDPAPAPPSPG